MLIFRWINSILFWWYLDHLVATCLYDASQTEKAFPWYSAVYTCREVQIIKKDKQIRTDKDLDS